MFGKLRDLVRDLNLEDDIYEEGRALAHRYFLRKQAKARERGEAADKVGHFKVAEVNALVFQACMKLGQPRSLHELRTP